jgi:transglutaminase-like putative cysteine protease
MTATLDPHHTAPVPPGVRQLDTHWRTRTIAAVLLGLAGMGIWLPQLGGGVLWILPVLVFAILVMVRAIEPRTTVETRLLGWSWLLWLPLAIMLSGASFSMLNPLHGLDSLAVGAATLLRGSSGSTALATWLAVTGMCWILGAVQATRPGRGSAAAAFVLLTLPFALAFAVSRTGDAGWYGAALLTAALLWATRGTLRAALPAALIVGLIGTLAAAAIGPTERQIPTRTAKLPTGGLGGIGQDNGSTNGTDDDAEGAGTPGENGTPEAASDERGVLNSTQTYASIEESDEEGGQPVVDFEVRSPEPAFWRVQVLDRWDGRGWSIGAPAQERPQPAARLLRTTVTMRRLQEARVIGAGRVRAARGDGRAEPADGETRRFAKAPDTGESYRVVSELVPADLATLGTIPIPSPEEFVPETQVWEGLPATIPIEQRIAQLPQDAALSGWEQVFRTAQRLSAGQTTQIGVVRNVLDYLRSPLNFTYSLSVPKTGPQPLVTFLTDTHVGYCQHYAGAAALLLRLAGIPTRVAVGYATGTPGANGYVVRRSDAHAWIEVYFEGQGWVPFDATSSSAAAEVSQAVDPTAPPRDRHVRASINPRDIAVLILGALAIGAMVLLLRQWRRRERRTLPELLLRVVPGVAGPATTMRAIDPDLRRIGPATAALAQAVERDRFVPGAGPGRLDQHPWRRLWRALVRDVGLVRGTWLLIFGAPPPDPRSDGTVAAAGSAPSLGDSASVAPPPGS